MSQPQVRIPFEAYAGDEPYLFISYSHRDSAEIYLELARLRNGGYRIWYDEGIDPGNDWPDAVAQALARASLFLVFLSPHAVESRHVRDEINFALSTQKPILPVYLAETTLTPGLALRLGSIQAVMKYRTDAATYCRKMEKALPDRLRIPKKELQMLEALSAIQRVLAHGESWCVGYVDLALSEDGTHLEGKVGSEIYPSHVRDLLGYGWVMNGGTGPSDPPQGCHQRWPVEAARNDPRSIAASIIYLTELEGYGNGWWVRPDTNS